MKRITLSFALSVLIATFAQGQHIVTADRNNERISGQSSATEMGIYSAGEVKWTVGPASLPAGAKIAVLEGDPAKEGFFTMRLWLPNGYKIPPHWHPKVEHVTVISGTFNLGMGEKFDQAATRAMPAGSFGFWSAGMKHFVWSNGDTIVQLHGIGPWSISYVNPADDPRNMKK